MVAKKLFFLFLLITLMANIIEAGTLHGGKSKEISSNGSIFHTTEMVWVKSMDSKERSDSDFDKGPGLQIAPSENSEGGNDAHDLPVGSVFHTTEEYGAKRNDLSNDEPYFDETPSSQSDEESAVARISSSIVKIIKKLINGAKSAIDYYEKKV